MSTNRDFCQTQLYRCCGQLKFDLLLQPGMEPGRKELIDALVSAARDNDHAEQIIDRWLKTSPRCPTPFDLYQMAEQLPAEDKPPAGCDVCKGEPYVPGPNGGLDRCSCARGDWYREHERKAAEERRVGQ